MTDIAELSVPISADTKAIDAALRQVEADLARLKAPPIRLPPIDMPSGDPIGEPFRKSVPSIEAAERATLSFAQARARLLRDQGDLAGSERVLQGALSATTASTTKTIAVQRQLLAVQKEIAGTSASSASGLKSLAGAASGLNAALGTVGLGVGISTVVQFGAAAVSSANQLEKTQATLRAVAGSQDIYNQVVQIAEANQRMFGGTLNDNLAPMQQFLFIANRSGASLTELNQAAQLLSTINPAEGFEGAGVALSEFFSGDITSLAERFNLPRAALRDLTAEGVTAQQKLAGLEQLLAAQGVTAQTLAASLNTTAATYDQLGASLGNLTTQFGGLVSEGLQPAAAGANAVAQGASELLSILTGGTGQISAAHQALAAGASTYEEYRAAAEAAQNSGVNFAAGIGSQFGPLGELAARLAGAVTGTEILSEAEFNAAQAAATQAEAQAAAAAATGEVAAVTETAAQAAANDALAKLEEEAAAMRTAQAHDALKAAIEQAAGSSGSAQGAAAAIAAAFGIEEAKVIALINAHRELKAARSGSAGAAQFAGGGGRRAGGVVGDDGTVTGRNPAAEAAAAREAAAAKAAAAAAKAAAAEAALRDQTLATGTAAQIAALRQDEYNAAVKRYGADSAEAIRAQTALMQAQAKGARAGGGGGGGGTSPATKAAEKAAADLQKTEEKYRAASLQADERYQDAALSAEEAYQEKRLSIIADFAERRAESERSFADAQVNDRADFYTSLASVDKSQRTKLIQDYEAAQTKAAEIASTQGADAGEKYLATITDILRARAQRAEAIRKALEDGDKEEAKFLQGVDAIATAAEQRKLDQIATGGDALKGQEQSALAGAASDRDKAIADADRQRQEALATAGEKAGDALETAQGRLASSAGTSNLVLQQQLDLLSKIQQAGGGATSATTPAASTATTGAATPAPTTPAPVAPPPGGGPLAVLDAATLAAIGDLGAKLDRVRSAIGDLRSSGALGGG